MATTKAEDAHDGHNHDGHDHDGHDHDEPTEEERAEAEADVERMGAALAALDDAALAHGLTGMSEKSRGDLAVSLNLPRATLSLGDALVPLTRRKLRTASVDRQLTALFAIVEQPNDQTIAALGDRAEDPTRDDLLNVLPAVVEQHGAPLVTAMMAGYAATDAPCRPVMRELLDTDERFVIGPAVELTTTASDAAAEPEPVDEAELAEKREKRRAAKEAKRQAEQKAREARAKGQAARKQKVHAAKHKTRS